MYGFVQFIPGMSHEEYRRVVEALGDEPHEGMHAHIAGPYSEGWRITEVWSSGDHYAAWERQRLLDALVRSGVMVQSRMPPVLERLDVRHLITYGPLDIREAGD